MNRITTAGAACAIIALFAGPALADCAEEIVMAKQMADQASDPAKREMAMQHLAMAQEKITGGHGAMQGEPMMSED
jgi:hypothetical protein